MDSVQVNQIIILFLMSLKNEIKMKNKLLLLFLVSLALISIFFSIKKMKEFEQKKTSIIEQSRSFVEKNSYLERCLNYSSLIIKDSIPTLKDEKIVLYFSGEACFSCIESLMKLLKNEYNLENKVYVLTDDRNKEESIASFNDGYNSNYRHGYKSDNLLGKYELNDILVIKYTDNQIKVLEYRPEEEHIFKEYFESFFLVSN